jgi:hypothetical protein
MPEAFASCPKRARVHMLANLTLRRNKNERIRVVKWAYG